MTTRPHGSLPRDLSAVEFSKKWPSPSVHRDLLNKILRLPHEEAVVELEKYMNKFSYPAFLRVVLEIGMEIALTDDPENPLTETNVCECTYFTVPDDFDLNGYLNYVIFIIRRHLNGKQESEYPHYAVWNEHLKLLIRIRELMPVAMEMATVLARQAEERKRANREIIIMMAQFLGSCSSAETQTRGPPDTKKGPRPSSGSPPGTPSKRRCFGASPP